MKTENKDEKTKSTKERKQNKKIETNKNRTFFFLKTKQYKSNKSQVTLIYEEKGYRNWGQRKWGEGEGN